MLIKNLKVIIIDDDVGDIELLKRIIGQIDRWQFDVLAISESAKWNSAFDDYKADIIFLDYILGPETGLELLGRIKNLEQSCPVILLTGSGDENVAVAAMHLGAADYLMKGLLSPIVVERTILNALQKHALQSEIKKHQLQLEKKVAELEKALAHVKQLQGLLPICSFCKKIRDDSNTWNQMEEYISHRSDAEFSHSICDECLKEQYPELDLYQKKSS